MKVSDIVEVLETFAPLGIQEKWDNSGLLVGSPAQEVHGVLVAFDCTAAVVEEAVARGADMVVTHHPLIFGGIRRIRPEDPTGLALMRAIEHHVAVYAAHTTADKVLAGVSGAMARRLGLQDVRVLSAEGDGSVGLGAVGDLPKALSFDEALARVKEAFSLKVVRCSRRIDTPIRRVAVCGGSGSSLIGEAMAAGAQLYLCGDVTYHHFFTPDGFAIMDIGHFESEVEIVDILYSLLRENFPTFVVHTSAVLKDSNPILYL